MYAGANTAAVMRDTINAETVVGRAVLKLKGALWCQALRAVLTCLRARATRTRIIGRKKLFRGVSLTAPLPCHKR